MSDDPREELERMNAVRAMHGLEPVNHLIDRPDEPVFDAGEERQAKVRKRLAEHAERLRRAMVAAVMDTAQGRAWIWELLVRCRVYAAIAPSSALAMAYAEGERSVGLVILADVQAAAPDRYAEMVKEANERALDAA